MICSRDHEKLNHFVYHPMRMGSKLIKHIKGTVHNNRRYRISRKILLSQCIVVYVEGKYFGIDHLDSRMQC